MNLILLRPEQLSASNQIMLDARQSEHVCKVLKCRVGDRVRVGLLGGNIGQAEVLQLGNPSRLVLESLSEQAPPMLPMTLILALPRPQMIKRILQTLACMGVEQLCLLQTAKVEKSFWQSPAVSDHAVEAQLTLGLEQAVATTLPRVDKFTRFRPFVEDHLPEIAASKHRLLAHPGAFPSSPQLAQEERSIVAIGPEGGFTEREIAYFSEAGFGIFQMGPRILKVETAVTAVIARLYPG